MKHPYEMKAFNRGGDEMVPMLVDEKMGRSSAWDVQFTFAHFCNHAVSIVPCVSYTDNIGMDGSGTHCQSVSVDIVDPSRLNQNKNPKFLNNLYFDTRIIDLMYSAFARKKRPLWQKAVNFIARELGRKPPFVIKRRVFSKE